MFCHQEGKVTKSRAQNKETCFFFCRDGVNSRLSVAKLLKIPEKVFKNSQKVVLRTDLHRFH